MRCLTTLARQSENRHAPPPPTGACRSGVPPAAAIDLIVLRSLAVSGVRLLVSLVLATAWIFPAAAEAATHLQHPTALETFPHFEAHDGVHHADHCLLDAAAMVADRGLAEDPVGQMVPPPECRISLPRPPSGLTRLLAGQSLSRAPPTQPRFG